MFNCLGKKSKWLAYMLVISALKTELLLLRTWVSFAIKAVERNLILERSLIFQIKGRFVREKNMSF